MRTRFQLLVLLCALNLVAKAQNNPAPWLDLGSPAPPLMLRGWLEGKPVTAFEKGRIYVVEFWATWCLPCRELMPSLSALARRYRRSVKVIGVDIYEKKTTTLPTIRSFVDSMGHKMRYAVAVQDSDFMQTSWMAAAGENAIPTAFVIDKEGKLAWIGLTSKLPGALARIVDNKWDISTAKTERAEKKKLEEMDGRTFGAVEKYASNAYMKDFFGEPDSALFVLDNIIAKDTGLRYETATAALMLRTLLRMDAKKAYNYGKMLMASKYPSYDAIIGTLKDYPYQYNTLPGEIFELGAEACQGKMDLYPWSIIAHSPENYLVMADWYLRANNKTKARQAMRKAFKALKGKRKI